MSPQQHASASGAGNIIVQITGDHDTVNIHGHPYLALVPAAVRTGHAQQAIDRAKARNQQRDPHHTAADPDSILHLLSPYLDIIPLKARAADLDSLKAWLHAPQPAISIRVIAGGAGAGKTRFATEALRRFCSNTEQWLAGFLTSDHLASFVAQHNFAAWQWPKPVFAVGDYASASGPALAKWCRALADLPLSAARPPLRILLLDRYASPGEGWFKTLLEANADRPGAAALFESRQPLPLSPIPTGDDRRALLREMLDAAAAHACEPSPPLPDPGRDPEFERQLTQPLWADPLYLLMAALVARDTGVSYALALSRKGLADWLARQEGVRLDRFGPRDEGAQRLRRHLASVVTLAGGLGSTQAREEAAHAADALALHYTGGSGQCAIDLARAWRAPAGGVAPIGLDIIGEAFVLQTLAPEDRRADGDAAVSRLGARAVPVLIRAAQNFSTPVSDAHRVEQHRGHPVDHDPVLPSGRPDPDPAPLEWLGLLIAKGVVDAPGLLSEIESALPLDSLALRDTAAHVTGLLHDRFAALAKSAPTAESGEQLRTEQARLANNLSVRQAALGRREEASTTAEEAVRLYRKLAATRPDAFLPDLAMSLNTVANRLSDLGRREDALAAAEEAVRLRRQLAATRPDAFLPDLAMSLNNVATMLSALGRREDALAAAEEAVRLRRQLAATRPDAFLPDVAMSLNNVALRLSDLGRREDALAAAEEGVQLYRQLAASRPDAFLPNLAASLNTVATMLSDLGRREDALAAAEEAVRLYRQLAAARPDAFLPNLAGSLNNVANGLSDLGRREDALAAAEEAVRLRRQLAASRPDAFLPDLATSLNTVATMLSDLGRREDALAAAEEAVQLYRQLAATRPDAFLPNLAAALNTVATRLSDLGHREDALAAAEQAVRLRRQLAASRPDAFLPDLAAALNNVANMLSALGRREDALAAAEQAVRLYRQLAASRPDAFLPNLAMSLNTVANMLSALGRREDALAAAEQAVRLRRQLAASRPDAFLPDLAAALNNVANMLSALGRREDALAAAEEAARLYRQLAASRPDAFLPNFVTSLWTQGGCLRAAGREADALTAFLEGVRILRPQFLKLSAPFARLMAGLVQDYIQSLQATGAEPDLELLTPILEAFARLNAEGPGQ